MHGVSLASLQAYELPSLALRTLSIRPPAFSKLLVSICCESLRYLKKVSSILGRDRDSPGSNPTIPYLPCLWKLTTKRRWTMQSKKLEPILLVPKSLFSMLQSRKSLVDLPLPVPFSIAVSVCQSYIWRAEGFPLTDKDPVSSFRRR